MAATYASLEVETVATDSIGSVGYFIELDDVPLLACRADGPYHGERRLTQTENHLAEGWFAVSMGKPSRRFGLSPDHARESIATDVRGRFGGSGSGTVEDSIFHIFANGGAGRQQRANYIAKYDVGLNSDFNEKSVIPECAGERSLRTDVDAVARKEQTSESDQNALGLDAK